MSNKGRCIDIIEKFPDERLSYVAELLENAYKLIEESLDDAFCIALAERHENAIDKDAPTTPIEELAKNGGLI